MNSEPKVELTAKFLLETRGSWNSWFNQAIENHINHLTMISNGDRHIKVIRKVVNIYTVDFEKEEQVELV